jgi:hypothetical protein
VNRLDYEFNRYAEVCIYKQSLAIYKGHERALAAGEKSILQFAQIYKIISKKGFSIFVIKTGLRRQILLFQGY